MKHIGIVAHSAEGAALCYRTVVHEGIARLGPHYHPQITMTGVAMHASIPAWGSGDYPAIRATHARDIEALKAAGADFFILPDNSAHLALECAGSDFALPGLHIAEVLAQKAVTQGYRKIGILGTQWTMEGNVYPNRLSHHGLKHLVPEADDRDMIHHVIMNELCLGVFAETSKDAYIRVIKRLAGRGCDAVALVCTEIPLLITPDVSPLPTLDSTRLLAAAAVDVSLGSNAYPSWRGGTF
ncbi:MAG: aspartate/glutamate racemase family protein [Sphingorhabdus sp.]